MVVRIDPGLLPQGGNRTGENQKEIVHLAGSPQPPKCPQDNRAASPAVSFLLSALNPLAFGGCYRKLRIRSSSPCIVHSQACPDPEAQMDERLGANEEVGRSSRPGIDWAKNRTNSLRT